MAKRPKNIKKSCKTAFSKGAIVELKSGGPRMTVESTAESDGNVGCVWYVGNEGEYRRASIAECALRAIEPAAPAITQVLDMPRPPWVDEHVHRLLSRKKRKTKTQKRRKNHGKRSKRA